MPIWLVSALALLGARFGGPAVGALARRVAPTAIGVGGGIAAGELIGGLFDGDGRPQRRRRRRALTQSDRNDIAFITATLGAPAGKQFAMIIASQGR